ncbi:MAG: methyltransferase [Chloroflexi bacterium]|nr:methyltransferase [Chloroflexota bacterium]
MLDLSDEQAYALAPHMATLLVDADGPNYMGGMAHTFVALRESFLDLRAFVKTGQREWWSGFDSEWIEAVGDSGQAYYRRILERVLPHLPAVHAKLEAGARVLDLACGVCKGPIKVARAYPSTTFTVADGDAYTLEQARTNLARHGLAERFEVLHAPLEELTRHIPGQRVPVPGDAGGLSRPARPTHERHPVLRGAHRLPAPADQSLRGAARQGRLPRSWRHRGEPTPRRRSRHEVSRGKQPELMPCSRSSCACQRASGHARHSGELLRGRRQRGWVMRLRPFERRRSRPLRSSSIVRLRLRRPAA